MKIGGGSHHRQRRDGRPQGGKGHEGNAKDGIWKSLKNPKQQAASTIPFTAMKGGRLGEWAAKFDLVLGVTPEL